MYSRVLSNLNIASLQKEEEDKNQTAILFSPLIRCMKFHLKKIEFHILEKNANILQNHKSRYTSITLVYYTNHKALHLVSRLH